MKLKKLECDLTVCKLEATTSIDLSKDLYFIRKTYAEISRVCTTADPPRNTTARADGW